MAASLPVISLQGLTWQNPSGDQQALVAPVDLDFTTYSAITVNPHGNFNQKGDVAATGVVVDNLLNVAPMTVNLGPIRETIPPFTKQTLQLPGNPPALVFSGTSAVIRATFFYGAFSGSTSGTNFYQAQLQAGLAVETGMIYMFGGQQAAIPAGYLLCDGTAVSRSTYAGLFAVIGTIYGTGDGSTTFNLPDMRGRQPIGSGTGNGLSTRKVGDTGGAEQVTITATQLPVHTHTVNDPGHVHGFNTQQYNPSVGAMADGGPYIGLQLGTQGNVQAWGAASTSNVAFINGRTSIYDGTLIQGWTVTIKNATTGISLNYAGGSGGTAPNRSDATTQPTPTLDPFLCLTFVIKT